MTIRIFYDEVKFRLNGWKKVRELFEKVICEHSKSIGDLKFIITTDKNLKKINVQFLEHDYYTDVIAFNYNEGNHINGEIFISLETVKINSVNYKVSLREELTRVMLHGVLHLLGYNDKSDKEKKVMRNEEDKWLKKVMSENGRFQI